MASLDHRLNPLFSIKECSSCGALYTADFCCSKGSFENKILVPKPPQNCATCGDPVDGLYCRPCAFVRKCLNEGWYTIHDENEILNTSESSNHNTNVVSAPQEPFVFNQDPGVNSSQSPLQINHNCCYKCGDSLDDIFCQRCTCKSCGNGAHIGYNCPPKAPIISNPEQCNQTINELPQTLPSVHPTCNSGDENSFTYDSKPNSFNDSPSVLTHPPQLQFETYLCELCGNNAHYGYDCPPQFPLVYEQEPFTQPQPPQDSVDHQGILQVLNKMEEKLEEIIRDRRKKIEDMSIEEMMHEQQLVDREIKEIINDLGYKRFRGEEIDEEYERDCEIRIRKLKQDFNIWGSEVRKKEQAYEEEKYYAACRYMLSITCDDEDDYIPSGDIIARYSTSKSITPDLPIQEPNNSLNMGDEHLDTIPATESDEVIKSSVENLVPIPSEFEGISNDTCDVLTCDNDRIDVESDFVESLINRDTSIVYSSKIDPILEEFAGELAHIAPIPPGIVEADFDPNDNTSSDDDDFEDIEYVSLEEVNDVNQEEKEFDLDDILQIQDVILHNPIPVMNSDSSVTSLSFSDNSLPEFESFNDHSEESRSGNTTTHANYSLPEYESFHFDNPSFPRPPPEPPNVCLDMLYNDESFEPGEGENIVVSNVEEDDSFTFTIRTFLPFLTYP
ncbi:hypothetical protein Tco_0218601 [Tanacetum coccineum]